MGRFSTMKLKLAAIGICVALLLAVTVNVVADFWVPQIDLKKTAMPPEEAVLLISPAQQQSLPQSFSLPEQQASAPAQPQWNLPLFELKFDLPAMSRSSSMEAVDFSRALGPNAALPQVLPPALPGSDPAPAISFRPIFGSKAGGLEGTGLGAAGNLPGVGAASVATGTASSLLKH